MKLETLLQLATLVLFMAIFLQWTAQKAHAAEHNQTRLYQKS